MRTRICLFVSAVFLCGACVPRAVTVRATAGLLENGVSAVYGERDPQFARDAMPGQLMLTEVLLKNDPENTDLLKSLAEGYFGYAFLFLEEEEPERAAEFYRRAADYGERVLRRQGLAGLASASPKKRDSILARARGADVPALYWTASAWAGIANIRKNDTQALTFVPLAAAMMRRVLDMNPAYQHGGADIFFGVYYSGRPRLAGGDPDKGKAHFEAALRRTGRHYLMAQYLYAKFYSVAVMGEEQFKALLAEIADAPREAMPAAALPNAVAQSKAKKLLARFDDLF
ncbi:MAG: TRAP transporter TatT component family protein [Elusimicrobiota bacterium]